MWYRWDSSQAFDSWHAAVIASLDLPRPGHNARTGSVNERAQWTTAYTFAVVVADDDVRAVVEQHIAAAFPEGLGVSSDSPPADEVI